jgi:hypothetical protein
VLLGQSYDPKTVTLTAQSLVGAKDWARRDGDAFVGCRKEHFFKNTEVE